MPIGTSDYCSLCIISELKRNVSQKLKFFHIPPAFDAPIKGDPLEFSHILYWKKMWVY